MKKRAYYHHLDALRSFAMLFGVFVHVGTLRTSPTFEAIAWVSDHFRMALFFLVSAMLGTIVLRTRDPFLYMRQRLFTLLVPFVATLLIFNIPTIALILEWRRLADGLDLTKAVFLTFGIGGKSLPFPYTWHLHLWFLLSLAGYSLILPYLVSLADRVKDQLSSMQERLSVFPTLWIFLTILSVGVGQRIAYQAWLFVFAENWIARATLYYLPFVVLGMSLIKSVRIHLAFSSLNFKILACGMFAILFEFLISSRLTGSAGQFFALIAKYLITLSLLHLLYALAIRVFNRPRKAVRLIIDAIFTVYLFHYFLIYVLATSFFDRSRITDFQIFAIGLVVVIFGIFLHHAVIGRSRILSTLFNGVPPTILTTWLGVSNKGAAIIGSPRGSVRQSDVGAS